VWVGWLAGCGSPGGGETGGSSGAAETAGVTVASTVDATGASTVASTSGSTSASTAAPSSGEPASGEVGDPTGAPTTGTATGTTPGTTGTTGPVDPGGPVVVENPGFEVDAVAPGDYDATIVPAGWSAYDPESILGLDFNTLGVLNPTGSVLYPDGAPEGSNVALVFLWRMQTDDRPAGLVQELAAALEPDTEYTLRVKVGNIAPDPEVAWDLGGFPGYRVELLAGGVVLAADDDTLAPAEGEFLQSECAFTAGADHPALGAPLAIRLINLNVGGVGIEVNFDDVELLAAPAP
jgi:hypothetical protein